MKTQILSIAFILVSAFVSAQTADAFQVVEKEQVPVPVIEAYESDYGDARAPEWRVHLNIYEVKNGKEYYRFNENGDLVEKRVKMSWNENAPSSLKEGKLKTYYKFWDVTEFYQAEEGKGNVYYVLQLKEPDTNDLATIYFDNTGNLRSKSHSGM